MDYPELEARRSRRESIELADPVHDSLLADSIGGATTLEGRAALLHFASSSYTRTNIIDSDGLLSIPAIFPAAAAGAIRLENDSKANGERTIRRPIEATILAEPALNDLEGQRRRIAEMARRSLSEEQFIEFERLMGVLESRGLAGAEVALTYHHIARLFSPINAALPVELRNRLALQTVHNAAVPTDISQGIYNTCNVAAVEVALYTRRPSIAARLVADVALTGRYTGTDGTLVIIDPSPQSTDAVYIPVRLDNGRSHASEIFQIAAVNLLHSSQAGRYRYQLVTPEGGHDTGERLIEVATGREARRAPWLSDADIVTVARLITGDNTIGMIHSASNRIEDRTGIVDLARSQQELEQLLIGRAAAGHLPVIVRFNASLEPFVDYGTDMNPNLSVHGAHVVTVTEYHPGPPPRVTVDNTWGRNHDFTGDRRMLLSDLWKLMHIGEDALRIVTAEVDALRTQGIFDPAREMELLRLQVRFRSLSNESLLERFNWFGEQYLEHCRRSGGCTDQTAVLEAMYVGPLVAREEATLARLRFLHEHSLVSETTLFKSLARLHRLLVREGESTRLTSLHAFIRTLSADQRRAYMNEFRLTPLPE